MTSKVCVVGHFGGDKVFLDGQTVKTKIVTEELKRQLGNTQVSVLDTYGGKKALIKCFFKSFVAIKNSENVIMLPAHNGVRFFTPVLLFWNLFFHRKLHYSVIGGWLPDLAKKNKLLCFLLKKFDYIYVETETMRKALNELKFENVIIVPNCKKIGPVKLEELEYQTDEPYRLCTFSRVNRLKGIEDAANVIIDINSYYKKNVYELDIYGRIDSGEEEWFEGFMQKMPKYIRYCGQVLPSCSVDVIKKYFALMFPTKYYTEGIPGTILDAYFAGVPVISARWQSFGDIIDDGVTGIGYEFGNVDNLKQKMLEIKNNVEEFNNMKSNCIKKSEQYIPNLALKIIVDNVNKSLVD